MNLIRKLRNLRPDPKNPKEAEMQKQISEQAMVITKKTISRKLTSKDVDKLAKLYKEYFEAFPNAKRQKVSDERIDKLRKFAI